MSLPLSLFRACSLLPVPAVVGHPGGIVAQGWKLHIPPLFRIMEPVAKRFTHLVEETIEQWRSGNG